MRHAACGRDFVPHLTHAFNSSPRVFSCQLQVFNESLVRGWFIFWRYAQQKRRMYGHQHIAGVDVGDFDAADHVPTILLDGSRAAEYSTCAGCTQSNH